MENRNIYSAYGSGNVAKSDECTDYDAVIKQFDDLISELSNANTINHNVPPSDNLLDIIQENTTITANSKENDFEISMNNSSNVPDCFSENFYSNQSKKSNLVLPRNGIGSASQNMPVLGKNHIKPSSDILNSQKMKESSSESGRDIPWINSHLWHTEKCDSQAEKLTSSKYEQNTSFGNSINPNRIDVSSAKNFANISERSNYFNRNISYSDRIIKNYLIKNYPESKRIKSHQPSSYSENFKMAGVYDPKVEFQRDLAVKSKIRTSGSCVVMSPRLHRSSFRYISSDSCFMVKLFIETKDSHLGPFTFEIYPKMSLRLLKLKVEKEYGIISSSQRWILGKTFAVDNDKALVDYNVMPGLPIILYVDNKHTIFSSKIQKEEYSFDNDIQLNDASEASKPLDDNGSNNLVDKQRNLHSEVVTENKFDSLDLKHVSKSKNDNLHFISHSENVLANYVLTKGEKSYDGLSNVGKSPASKNKLKKTLLLKDAKIKDSDSLELNMKNEKESEFKNVIEQNLNNERNGLDAILPKEKISVHEKIGDNQNSVNAKLTDSDQFCTLSCFSKSHTSCGEKEVLHSAVFSNTFIPSSNLRAEENINLLYSGSHNRERYSHDEFEIKTENIEEKNQESSLKKLELKNLEFANDFENTVVSSLIPPAEIEKPENLHETVSPGINTATSSKRSLTSILRKLSLTRKATSKDDANTDNDFSKVDTANIMDQTISDYSTPPADQSFTDIHIEISCSLENVQAENEHEENLNNFQDEIKSVENLEAVKNFELLQEIENTDLVQNAVKFICPVCFDDFDSGQGAVLHDCLHIFCRSCLMNSVVHAEGALVKCPYRDDFYSCESYLQQREIKALVSEEVYEKYLQRSIMTAEGLADRSFHCKTPNCPGWCIYDNAINVFHCPVCFRYNCLNCQAIHERLNCRQYQNKLKEQQKVDENSMKTLDLLNKMIEGGKALKCPKCELILMKKWGCDWLKCSICKTEICWITRGPRWGPGGQGDTSGGCRCGVNGIKCHPSCTYCH